MIKKIAKVLGIKTYPAKLAVKQDNHSLSVSFQHQHLENKKIWHFIAFDVLFPKDSLEYDNGIYRPAHKNRMRLKEIATGPTTLKINLWQLLILIGRFTH